MSHSWDKPFGALVESIEESCSNHFTKPNFWIYAFGLLQGGEKEIRNQLGVGEKLI